jgi:hypothetical protein
VVESIYSLGEPPDPRESCATLSRTLAAAPPTISTKPDALATTTTNGAHQSGQRARKVRRAGTFSSADAQRDAALQLGELSLV